MIQTDRRIPPDTIIFENARGRGRVVLYGVQAEGCGQAVMTSYGWIRCAAPECGGVHATSFD